MSNSGRHGEIITDRRLASATFVVSIAGARLVTPRTEAVRWTSTMAHRVVVGLQHVEALRAILSSKTPGGRKRGNGGFLCEPQTVVNYGYAPTPSQLWLRTQTPSQLWLWWRPRRLAAQLAAICHSKHSSNCVGQLHLFSSFNLPAGEAPLVGLEQGPACQCRAVQIHRLRR